MSCTSSLKLISVQTRYLLASVLTIADALPHAAQYHLHILDNYVPSPPYTKYISLSCMLAVAITSSRDGHDHYFLAQQGRITSAFFHLVSLYKHPPNLLPDQRRKQRKAQSLKNRKKGNRKEAQYFRYSSKGLGLALSLFTYVPIFPLLTSYPTTLLRILPHYLLLIWL